VTTGLASVEELSARLEVTASTIRRDLALLNGQGRLVRTYGGAMALGVHPEASLRQRTGEAFEQKHTIARWAASVIRPGENILLDAGSTVGPGPRPARVREAVRDQAGHQHDAGIERRQDGTRDRGPLLPCPVGLCDSGLVEPDVLLRHPARNVDGAPDQNPRRPALGKNHWETCRRETGVGCP